MVVELKVGLAKFTPTDRRQVEEYAQDLRAFHEGSHVASILPVLWCTGSRPLNPYAQPVSSGVGEIHNLGCDDLTGLLNRLALSTTPSHSLDRETWETSTYRPVPTVVEAATTLFAGHGVEEIARADASNLDEAADKIVSIIDQTRRQGGRSMIFLTGVPGSGKTLAGLQVIHRAVDSGIEDKGDIVYLPGNTPLVTVIREALVRDEHRRNKTSGGRSLMSDVRSAVRTRIQHIIDFLREYLKDLKEREPHEHTIVFDEAQRAWYKAYGRKKFDRPASEPQLLLEIMGRHKDWRALVCLVGGGQEINNGENGVSEWGEALRKLPPEVASG